ncbi:MAG: universal stress protein [Cytophagales bacterium]|nr:universal stress protein [Cytophagales bacterium]
MMKKILCPVDFSSTSLNALEFAVAIAKKFHSSITLVNVFTERDFNQIVGEEALGKTFKELMNMAMARLRNLADSINKDPSSKGIDKCEYSLELGELTDQLEFQVTDHRFDLVVMGTTGISKTNGIFFGSHTEDVIDKIKIPVLCVPGSAVYQGFNKLVYASDFAEEDKLAIQEVISFATMFDSRVSVLHINQSDTDLQYKEFVEELSSFIQYEKIGFVNKEFKDSVGMGINEYMEDENSDLLVVFKRHRNFVQSIFHKSITKVLAYSTNKPLLVLKLEA